MSARDNTASFVRRHGLWSAQQLEDYKKVAGAIAEHNLQTIRFAFPDQHGILRGKTLTAREAARAFENGCSITSTLFAKDTSHRSVFPVFTAGGGFGMLALAGLLEQQGLLGAESAAERRLNPLAARKPHFAARARSVIWLFMNGGPSQVDTWDYKPELVKRDGQELKGFDKNTGFFT